MKLSDVILRDTTANQPAASSVPEGTLYFDTDLETLYRSDGTSTWEVVEASALSNPMTTAGDLIIGAASGVPARLGIGSAGEVLTVVSGSPDWAAATGGSGLAENGAIASRPAAGETGLIYMPDDDIAIGQDRTTEWKDWAPLVKVKKPGPQNLLAGLSWVNQGSASASEDGRGLLLTTPTPAAGVNARLLVKTAPSTPWTVTVAFVANLSTTGTPYFGFAGRQSSDGKFISAFWQNNNFSMSKFASATAYSAAYITQAVSLNGPLLFMRVTDNGTNRLTYTSVDGQNWRLWHTVGRTDYCTVDQIGIVADSGTSGALISQNLLVHWEVT